MSDRPTSLARRPRTPLAHRRGVAPALLVATLAWLGGCARETGILLSIESPAGLDSIEVRVARLRCGRREQEAVPPSASLATTGRDLVARPYRLLVTPINGRLDVTLSATVIGRRGDRVIAVDHVDLPAFTPGVARLLTRRLAPFDAPAPAPAEGCFCHDGLPWLGVAGSDCMVPRDRSLAAAGNDTCPADDPPPGYACDGVAAAGESSDRRLPCYVREAEGCVASERTCADRAGRAYEAGCDPGSSLVAERLAPAMMGASMCDRFAGCLAGRACGDPLRCLLDEPSAAPGWNIAGELDGPNELGRFVPCGPLPRGLAGAVIALPFGFDVPEPPTPSGVLLRGVIALVDAAGARRVVGRLPLVGLQLDRGALGQRKTLDVPLFVDHSRRIVQLRVLARCPVTEDGGVVDGGVSDATLDGGLVDASPPDRD